MPPQTHPYDQAHGISTNDKLNTIGYRRCRDPDYVVANNAYKSTAAKLWLDQSIPELLYTFSQSVIFHFNYKFRSSIRTFGSAALVSSTGILSQGTQGVQNEARRMVGRLTPGGTSDA